MMVRGLILLLASAAGAISLICAALSVRQRSRRERGAGSRRVTIVLENGSSRTVTLTEVELGTLLGAD